MKRNRRVKIVATIGPASSSPEIIEQLFECGADVFRINMSHTSPEHLHELTGFIREIEARQGRPIGILADLQGPKLRIGDFDTDEVTLVEGQEFDLVSDPAPGSSRQVHLPHPEIFSSIEPDAALLVNDGKIRLRVKERSADVIRTMVEVGGEISARKGVNLPDTVIPVGAMTDKDRVDLEAACEAGADWLGLSFVQRPEDVLEARKLVHGRIALMAKIEKPSALHHLDEILELVDGIMVARGDLGVELPLEQVPGRQNQITRAARRAGKPVVVATQMLESMIQSPVPTRAEVSDVATAVFEGADAIMLSAESAMGEYPDEAIKMMDRIAREVERDLYYGDIIHAQRTEPESTSADAISAAARNVADTLNLAAIVCYTGSGTTGMRASRERPARPIIALTPNPTTGRRLAVVWGLHCVLTRDAQSLEDMVDRACRIAFQEGFAEAGQRIIITAGVPLGTPGATNLLRIAFVGEDGTGAL